jgi:hypothetical protein
LSNPSLNSGEQPAKANPPHIRKGKNNKLSTVISNKIGNNNIHIIKQYPVNQYRLLSPSKYEVSDNDSGIFLYFIII